MSAVLENVKESKVLTYPMSLNYGKKDWNVVSALREFLSNMLDTQTDYVIDHRQGRAVITDMGEGLPKKSFIFGESSRDGSQIGQFGEGLKMAFITLLRENRKVEVKTKGFDVEVRAVDSEEYGSRVMEVEFHQNKKQNGTEIYAECAKEELEKAISLFLKLKEQTRLDKGIYAPGGSVYILGLKTTELPHMLFSYDIQDKAMSNRDRNIVDTAKLQENLIMLLREAKSQKLIQTYLGEFQEHPTAYEYQLAFLPSNDKLESWKKALQKLYPKACLSSDMTSDLHAHAMGYAVLRNVPFNLLQIFKKLGLQDSSLHAKNYKGEAVQQKNRLIYPISESYVSDWTRIDAIREFIANALDAGDPRLVHNGKEGRISDSGEGILKKHFVLGESGRRGQSEAIGKFGEGLKMACLVLSRTGSPVKVESVGTTYTAKLEYNEEFETKLLVVEFSKNNRNKGSSIVFACGADELESAKSRFLQFKGARKKPAETTGMEVYSSGNGTVYINGLETAKVNGLFDYNVRDKALLNSRDRNSVDDGALRRIINSFLARTNDEAVIEQMLTEWKTRKNAIEFQMNEYPKVIDPWAKWVKKLYPKAVFASGGYFESDFIAKQAGYELLTEIPQLIRGIFQSCGIKTSETIAQKYKNKGILFENKIVYPISSNYGSSWNVEKALRELIANAIDADPKCKIEKGDAENLFVISDKGEGISANNFLFGDTDKTKNDQKIGMFGEGLKMAALVFARSNRKFIIATKGTQYEAKIERDRQFNADVLVIYLTPSRKRIGTDILIQASGQEIAKAKAQFLTFNPSFEEIESGIYEAEKGNAGNNWIFVNGCATQNVKALFSYNLTDKTLLNRDRASLDMEKVKPLIASKWMFVKNKKLIEAFMINRDDYKLESQISFKPSQTVINAWKDVMKKVYDKTCFATGTDHDGVARDKGYKLLESVPAALAHVLRACGMKNSSEIVTLRGDEKVVKKRAVENELSAAGKRKWKKVKGIFGKLYGVRSADKIEIVAEFHTEAILGAYEAATDTIYILKDLIENEERYRDTNLVGTMIHEQVHRITGEDDRTRAFEAGLTKELGRLAMMIKI